MRRLPSRDDSRRTQRIGAKRSRVATSDFLSMVQPDDLLVGCRSRRDQAATCPGLIPHCWCGSAYVSLVGLRVSDPRCAGVGVNPRNFRQVKIRSYVELAQGGPPGVLFIRQFIAHRLTEMAARLLWREPFRNLAIATDNACTSDAVEYQWPNGHMKATASELWKSPEPDSLEEFLTVRQWAYQPRRIPRRYAAEREPWLLNASYEYDVECDLAALTQGLMPNPGRLPDSVLLADGGPVRITIPERIRPMPP